jgi:hypothetical protein
MKRTSSDNSDDDVPVSSLLKRKLPPSSEEEDDDVPIALLVVSKNLDVLAEVSAANVDLKGEACIGLDFARDFGPPHGVCMESIVRVDINRRRPLYHVLCGDGDEEDYDEGELQYARELFVAHVRGATLPAIENEEPGTTCMTYYCFALTLTSYIFALQAEPVRRMKPASKDHLIARVSVPCQKTSSQKGHTPRSKKTEGGRTRSCGRQACRKSSQGNCEKKSKARSQQRGQNKFLN